jgi:hypothetical protein
MDYMVGSDFTVSLSFMLPTTFEDGQAADGRGVIFSLWGLWAGSSYGGTDQANLIASSLIYDAYNSGSSTANLRVGFLYQNGDGSTENGWWSNKEKSITTGEFHTFTLAMQGLNCLVYIDGTQMASYTCYEGNAWGLTNTTFALGGAAGEGGTSAYGSLYLKYFDVYDFAMSGAEMSALSRDKLTAVSAAYIVSAEQVASTVTVNFDADDGTILAAAPKKSEVNLTLSDNTTTKATVIWTGVEKKGSEVYLAGTILGAGASNLYGVKAYMPVQLETIADTPAFISYDFSDPENVGKSNLGGIYDLVQKGNGTVTVEDGAVTLNKASLSTQTDANGYDYMDYMSDFTVEVDFKLAQGIEQPHIPLLSIYSNGNDKKNSAVLMVNGYASTAVSATLRVGFAYASTDSSDGGSEDGYANAGYWSRYNVDFSLGVWNKVALSYVAADRTVTAYLNGTKICSYQAASAAEFVGTECLALSNGDAVVSYRSLKIYDYVPVEENLATLSKAGVMPENSESIVSANKITAASSVTLQAEVAELNEATALKLAQQAKKTVRATEGDNTVKRNVLWDTATAQDDGTYKVTGIILGGYNPDKVTAAMTVSIKEYAVTFTATNAAVKVNGAETTSLSAKYGANVSFTVDVADGYQLVSVKVGETALTATEDVYTLEGVKAATAVTVETEVIPTPPVDPPTNSGDTSSDTSSSTPSNTTSDTTSDTPSNTTSDTTSDTPSNTTSDTTSDTPSSTPSNTTSDTTSSTTSETTSDTTSNTPSNTTSDTTSNTTSNTTSDTTSNTISNTATDTTTDKTSSEVSSEKKASTTSSSSSSGCKSSIAGGMMAVVSLMGAALLCTKKKDD